MKIPNFSNNLIDFSVVKVSTASTIDLIFGSPLLSASFTHYIVVPAMEALRKPVDKLEMLVDKEAWPMPSYGDLIFEVPPFLNNPTPLFYYNS